MRFAHAGQPGGHLAEAQLQTAEKPVGHQRLAVERSAGSLASEGHLALQVSRFRQLSIVGDQRRQRLLAQERLGMSRAENLASSDEDVAQPVGRLGATAQAGNDDKAIRLGAQRGGVPRSKRATVSLARGRMVNQSVLQTSGGDQDVREVVQRKHGPRIFGTLHALEALEDVEHDPLGLDDAPALVHQRREVRPRSEHVHVVGAEHRLVAFDGASQDRFCGVVLGEVPQHECQVLARAPDLEVIGAEGCGDPGDQVFVPLPRDRELIHVLVQRREVRPRIQRQPVLGTERGLEHRLRELAGLHRSARFSCTTKRVAAALRVHRAHEDVDLRRLLGVVGGFEDDRSAHPTIRIEIAVIDGEPWRGLPLEHDQLAE